MTERITLTVLLQMLEDDREVLDLLRDCELVAADRDSFAADEVECALVARTLLRELEVNAPGVEIILRMRSELLATRRQIAELLQHLRERQPG
jgi:hypothetical protein